MATFSTFTDGIAIVPGTLKLQTDSSGHFDNVSASTVNDAMVLQAVANSANANILTVSNAVFGQATTATIPDIGQASVQFQMVPSTMPIYSTSVTLTAAQVNGAYATPVQLIAAPGSGKTIVVQEAVFNLTYGSAAFTSGGVGIIQYGTTANGAGTNACSGTIAAATVTNSASDIEALTGNVGNKLTSVSNTSICWSNQTQAFATGTGCTVTIFLTYQVLPTGTV